MNEDELRIKIYEYLGLEIGSLSSESGNDWQRAKKDVLIDYKQNNFQDNIDQNKQDMLSINKEDVKYIFTLNSILAGDQAAQSNIAKRHDLDYSEIKKLISYGSKETIFNLIRFQKLTEEHINMIIPDSVYQTKILLISECKLTMEQKENLIVLMQHHPLTYKETLKKIKLL